ncbi:MAG TPA: flagellar assembly protein A, partial [Spirochaetia bacterium]|nr:flagellar assembly protein A [Spirochaetia bacterium]
MPRPKNEVQVQATLQLEFDADGRQAVVSVERAENGESWSAGRIIELLRSSDVTEIIPRDGIERKLRTFASGGERTAKFVVAEGEEPSPAKPEQAVWVEHAVPDKIRDFAAETVNSAPVPNITKETVTKVKRQKQITRKAALPFLPARKEMVEVVEREVKQERVYVDPTVEGTGWVESGDKIALVEPADPGLAGKDIYGKPVFAAALTESQFYAGMNIARKREELFAEATGFLRYGKNWAEIIPFEMHHWSVRLSPDRATCLLDLAPGSPDAPIPQVAEIIAETEKLSYSRKMLLPDSEIEQLVLDTIARGKAVEGLPISGKQDSVVKVSVTPDGLKAVLTLRKGRGSGKALSLREVGAAITAAGLKSFDKKRIQNEVTAFYRGPEDKLTDYILAEGKAPQKGADSVVEINVRFFTDEQTGELRAQLSDLAGCAESVASLAEDFPVEKIESMGAVRRDQRVLSYSIPGPGAPGYDVHGKVLPGIAGRKPELKLFEHLELKQNVVVATADGILDLGRGENQALLLRVRINGDAKVEISVSADRMNALLAISERIGCGAVATEESIRGAITAAGISAGVDDSAVRHAAGLAARGESVDKIIVARGEPPVRPGQRQTKYLVPLSANRGVVIRDDGTADYRNQDRMTTIEAGTEIAEIVLPTAEARSGFDVTGREIPAGATSSGSGIVAGPNVAQRVRDDGTTVLVAEASGELIVENNTVSIRSVHTIRGDVDLQTGNLRFNGPVDITGNVRTGFFVMAKGDIRVGEGVESALLSSDGDILVKLGVRGAGKAVLRTKKNLRIGFSEQAILLAVGDIVLAHACLHTRVKCNGRLSMPGEKGNLIGGTVQCRDGVEAANIGSERGVQTHISFGQNYLISDQIDVEVKEVERLKKHLTRVDSLIRKAEHSTGSVIGSSRQVSPALTALYHEKSKILRIMEKRNLRIFTLREKFEEHFPSEIRVRGTIFAGTTIESHGRILEISSPKKRVA